MPIVSAIFVKNIETMIAQLVNSHIQIGRYSATLSEKSKEQLNNLAGESIEFFEATTLEVLIKSPNRKDRVLERPISHVLRLDNVKDTTFLFKLDSQIENCHDGLLDALFSHLDYYGDTLTAYVQYNLPQGMEISGHKLYLVSTSDNAFRTLGVKRKTTKVRSARDFKLLKKQGFTIKSK